MSLYRASESRVASWCVIAALLAILLAVSCDARGQVFADGFESPEAPGPVLPECATDPDPLNGPAGFRQHIIPWQQAFFGNTYPSSGAPLAPVGSFTLRHLDRPSGPPIAGRYIAIPFTPGPGVYRLNWLQAQPIYENGYRIARPAASVTMAISECPGDFREALGRACRKVHSSTSIFYSGSTSGFNTCGLQQGKPYYLNVMFADGTDPATNTCLGGSARCEVNVRHELQSP